jgi:WD repeat and SOF domain-containing protein 1
MKSNALSWCPTLPTVLLLASEDHNLYTFDIRRLESPTQVYKGHVAAVMGCDWSGCSPSCTKDDRAVLIVVTLLQALPVKNSSPAATIAPSACGTGMKGSPGMSTTQSECKGGLIRGSPEVAMLMSIQLHDRVFDTTYTPTADFILSASDDGNVR